MPALSSSWSTSQNLPLPTGPFRDRVLPGELPPRYGGPLASMIYASLQRALDQHRVGANVTGWTTDSSPHPGSVFHPPLHPFARY